MAFRHALVFALACAAAGPAFAGSVTDLGLTLEQVRTLNAQLTAPIAAPGIAFGAPTAFGAGWGQAFAGLGGQTVSVGEDDLDGSAVLGVGFGDPQRALGLEAVMNVISLQEGLAEDGSWGFKLHAALPHRAGIAVGVDDTGGWGDAKEQRSSAYAVYTQVIDLSPETPKRPLSLAFNVGAGQERFAPPGDDVAPIGSVALSLHRQASVIADYSRGELNLAASVVPMYRIPLVVTAGFINVAERNADMEFAAGVGYLYSF
jgi:hypothetical protein